MQEMLYTKCTNRKYRGSNFHNSVVVQCTKAVYVTQCDRDGWGNCGSWFYIHRISMLSLITSLGTAGSCKHIWKSQPNRSVIGMTIGTLNCPHRYSLLFLYFFFLLYFPPPAHCSMSVRRGNTCPTIWEYFWRRGGKNPPPALPRS